MQAPQSLHSTASEGPFGVPGKISRSSRPASPRGGFNILDLFCQIKFIHDLDQLE